MIKIGNKVIIVKKGDITEESTDAIVNPANSFLRHGGGAARAIAIKGGAIIQKQSDNIIKEIRHLSVGKAVITDAGNLPCKFVIHTVGPHWGEEDESAKFRKAIFSSLTIAELYNLTSLSMPAVSSGIFGFPKPQCAKILMETCIEFLRQDDVELQKIVLCNFDDETYQIFLKQEQFFISTEEQGMRFYS